MKTKVLCVVAAVGGCFSFAVSQGDVDGPGSSRPEVQARREAISSEVVHFYKLADEWIDIIKSDADPALKEEAVYALRRLRAEKTVWVLLDNLTTIKKGYRERSDWGHLQGYACALALRDIGQAAVPGLVSQIIETRDKEQIQIGSYTLLDILGKEAAMQSLQKYMKRAGESATAANKKSFDSAMEILRAEAEDSDK